VTMPDPPAIPPGLESLLPQFVAEMEKDLALLQALAGGGAEALAEHVHAMRGKCAMFGEERLFALLTAFESRLVTAGGGENAEFLGAIVARVRQLGLYVEN